MTQLWPQITDQEYVIQTEWEKQTEKCSKDW